MFRILGNQITVGVNVIRASKARIKCDVGKPITVDIGSHISGLKVDGVGLICHWKTDAIIKKDCAISLKVNDVENDLRNILATIQIPMWDMMKVTFEGQEDYIIKGIDCEMSDDWSKPHFISVYVIPKSEISETEIGENYKEEEK